MLAELFYVFNNVSISRSELPEISVYVSGVRNVSFSEDLVNVVNE